VTPTRTRDAFRREFPTDPILADLDALFSNAQYREWRDVRNVLTHTRANWRGQPAAHPIGLSMPATFALLWSSMYI
jgi:hypothetical protein